MTDKPIVANQPVPGWLATTQGEYAEVVNAIVRKYAGMLHAELDRRARAAPDGYVLCVHRSGIDGPYATMTDHQGDVVKLRTRMASHVLPTGVLCVVGTPHEQWGGTAVTAAVRDGDAPIDPTGSRV